MRKLILLLLTVFAFTACEKQADLDQLEARYAVYTHYDPETDFASLRTFYLPDSILLIGDSKEAEYDTGSNAQTILDTWANNMESRGFIRTTNRDEAALGLQVSYVENDHHFTTVDWVGWGWDYPWYWDLGFWGNWGGWYYPFAVHYSYTTGSFLAELVNLTAPQGEDKQLPVVWNAYLIGAISDSNRLNTQMAIEGADDAFAQSPYLTCLQ